MGLTIQHNGGELPMEWLWMCALVLLIVPIIIAGYRYGMTYYVMLDEPQLKVRDAMKKSVELMYGNKLRLFGYSLLWGLIVGGTSILTGIVFSWLVPMW